MKATATYTARPSSHYSYSVIYGGEEIETRNSKRRYQFANVWKIGDGFAAELSAKPGRIGRINQYGWILVEIAEIGPAS